MRSKPRYLMFADGKSVHTYKWAKEFVKYYDLYIFTFTNFSNQISALLSMKNLFQCGIHIEPRGGNVTVFKCVKFAIKVINEIRPAFINAHYLTSYGTVACIASRFADFQGQLIMSTYGSDILITPAKNAAYFLLTRWLLKKADIVTSDSFYMTEKIKAIYNDTNVITFPFGVESLPDLGMDNKKDELLFFSNRALTTNYNIDKVIRCFAALWKYDNRRRLIIANDGPEKECLLNLANSLEMSENIKFVGFLSPEEQSEYYRICRYYFSLPSSDSTSVSLLEAMSFGCVPLVSNIPANREWIVRGYNGIVLGTDDDIDLNEVDKNIAFFENRNIIQERAIWEKNVKKFMVFLDKNRE